MKDDKVYLKHILVEMEYIVKINKNLTYETLIGDETLKRAVVRSLEIIGEASKNISKDFKENHTEIEWRELTGLRDKLIHYYFGVSWKRVWDVVEKLIPDLKRKVESFLDEKC